MRIAAILLLSLSVANAAPQGILSDIASALGITQHNDHSTTAAGKTLAPATVAATSTQAARASTSQTNNSPSPTQASTSQSGRVILPSSTNSGTQSIITSSSSGGSSNSSTTSTSSSSSSSSSTSSSSSSSSTSTPPPNTTQAATQPTQSPTSSSNANTVPPAGVAVAVIMTLAIVAAFAWLLFRHHPGIRRWWEEREEKRMQARSYRDAIDGPFAGRSGSSSNGTAGARKSMLASFFAPRTVVLGNGQEIRRKPVNWGARDDTVPPVPAMPMAMEKVALTEMAAPMARNDSMMSMASHHVTTANRSPSIGLGVTGLRTGSNRSSPAIAQKELPPMPPMPAPIVAELGGSEVRVAPLKINKDRDKDRKGDMRDVLTRKSVFELA